MKYIGKRAEGIATDEKVMAQTLVDLVMDLPTMEPATFKNAIAILRSTYRSDHAYGVFADVLADTLAEYYADTRTDAVITTMTLVKEEST